MSAKQAMLFGQWTEHMCFFPNGLEFPDEQLQQLAALGIDVVPGQVQGVDVDDDRLAGVRLGDGVRHPLDALAVPAFTRARLEGLDDLGLELQTTPIGVAVLADESGHTSVPGVWAAGNVVNAGMQVSESAANGARVAMTINTELVFEKAKSAMAHSATTAQAARGGAQR
ncbi:FAD-dependent oxidoreductase [Phytoactinopolyspora limicola]|uniref:FAD-dependent oxidoreductase n=1 Tax=Phytoactinopolyspora limicola TaxID=2715536 RepID=UPI001FE8A985|nr:FAD-dependent oxidoreductase [Phytoactinopolyspora limicola]